MLVRISNSNSNSNSEETAAVNESGGKTQSKSREITDNRIRSTIIELYQTIYRESFDCVKDIMDVSDSVELESIDPLTVVQEINGSQGLLYSSLMNEIFAYASYYIIKSGMKNGDEFRRVVLEDGVTPFKDLISDFMRIDGLNSFNLFVTQLLGIVDIDSADYHDSEHVASNYVITQTSVDGDNVYDYINTDYDSAYNNFDDRPCLETEPDKASIIRVNRALD